MLCIKCGGTGQYLGQGFMMTDCRDCPDEEFEKETPSLESVDRRSKSYKNAINEIMAINKGISREKAVKMFDEAYVKGG